MATCSFAKGEKALGRQRCVGRELLCRAWSKASISRPGRPLEPGWVGTRISRHRSKRTAVAKDQSRMNMQHLRSNLDTSHPPHGISSSSSAGDVVRLQATRTVLHSLPAGPRDRCSGPSCSNATCGWSWNAPPALSPTQPLQGSDVSNFVQGPVRLVINLVQDRPPRILTSSSSPGPSAPAFRLLSFLGILRSSLKIRGYLQFRFRS
jgi:hypothetical protein